MLPLQLITCLFTATIVSATVSFVNLRDFSYISWFMYIYLVSYRIKIFLDDLVYFPIMKKQAIGGGEPIIGMVSWLLWLSVAILLRNKIAYFGLTALNFTISVVWICIAKKKVPVNASDKIKDTVKYIKDAHSRWWKFNLVPVLFSGIYFFLLLNGKEEWSNPIYLSGTFIMGAGLLLDIITDYKFMFQIEQY